MTHRHPLHAVPIPAPVHEWGRAVARRHLYVLVHHPHHYATAALLTVFLAMTGHWEIAAIEVSWAYAALENIATAAEVLNDTASSV